MADGPYLTKADFERYLSLDAERRSLQRQAQDLGKQQDEIEAKILEYVQANGGKDRSCKRSGFALAILTKAGSVSWKQEFIRVAGREEAARLVDEAPTKDVLSVERAA